MAEFGIGRRLVVVACRPIYSAVWFTAWVSGAVLMVWLAVSGSGGAEWIGWPMAVVSVTFGVVMGAVTSAVAGPRGMRRLLPWSGWIDHNSIAAIEIGTDRFPLSVAARLNDGSSRVLLVGGPPGFFDVASKLEDSKRRLVGVSSPSRGDDLRGT